MPISSSVQRPKKAASQADETPSHPYRLFSYPSLPSTNDQAFVLLNDERKGQEASSPLPFVVVAEEQTHGRGRFGRTWYSPRGGLWFSIAWERPSLPDAYLGAAAALALCDTIQSATSCPALIRWPNDVVIHHKKVAGMLMEKRGTSPADEALVLGLGVNVNLSLDAFPETLRETLTSLSLETHNTPLLLSPFLHSFLSRFHELSQQGINTNTEELRTRWKEQSSLLNQRVHLYLTSTPDKRISGRVADIDLDLGLFLETDTGAIHHFQSEIIYHIALAE